MLTPEICKLCGKQFMVEIEQEIHFLDDGDTWKCDECVELEEETANRFVNGLHERGIIEGKPNPKESETTPMHQRFAKIFDKIPTPADLYQMFKL